jgi:hypothetical protein
MTSRTLLIGGAFALLAGLHSYLILKEEIVSFEGASTISRSEQDALLTIRYNATSRRENLRRFGLDDALTDRVVAQIEATEAEHGRRLEKLLKNAGDPQAVADGLCGELSETRPRYGALPFVVEERGTERRVIDVGRISSIDAQPWAVTAQISGVYGELEQAGEERQEDATLIAIAAILLGQEPAAIQRSAPWGSALWGRWSWGSVQERFPTAKGLMVNYFATMHLVVELAQREGGICD